ncbi:MAG: hypothetical protein GPJ13_22215, partial [Microcystis aeruginosa W11-06]|nr:hypothetical protein [Microcystis aeruginosa W11-06]
VSNMELRGIERGKEIGKEIGQEIGKEIGKEIGALENSRDDIRTVLTVRFGQISSEIEEMIDKITNLALLKELLKLAATANSLAEFKQSLTRIQYRNS